MTTPIERAAAALQEAMRELIPEDLARLKAEHEATHASGGYLMPDRLYSPIPDNLHGVVQDESVAVSFPSFSPAIDLETLLGQIIAALGATGFDVNDILTAGGEVLVGADGNVLVSG